MLLHQGRNHVGVQKNHGSRKAAWGPSPCHSGIGSSKAASAKSAAMAEPSPAESGIIESSLRAGSRFRTSGWAVEQTGANSTPAGVGELIAGPARMGTTALMAELRPLKVASPEKSPILKQQGREGIRPDHHADRIEGSPRRDLGLSSRNQLSRGRQRMPSIRSGSSQSESSNSSASG